MLFTEFMLVAFQSAERDCQPTPKEIYLVWKRDTVIRYVVCCLASTTALILLFKNLVVGRLTTA